MATAGLALAGWEFRHRAGVAKSPSPVAGAVPWLLLKGVKFDGTGVLSKVELVRRSETKGGAAPGGACDVGALTRVPYEATYTFYSEK